MTDIKQLLADIEAGLEGVTPGPWTVDGWLGVTVTARRLVLFRCLKREDSDHVRATTTRHIARLSPENMRAILDHIRQVERERDEAAWERDDTIRRRIPDHFLLVPPDGGDVKTWEAVDELVAEWRKAERERDEARAALKEIRSYTEMHGGAARTLKLINSIVGSEDKDTAP